MDIIWDRIENVAKRNNGHIKTSDVEEAGVSRPMIKKYLNAGKLERVRKGLYVLADGFADEFALMQAQSSKAVYSYGTALYFWGLSDRVPHILDMTFPRGANVSRLKKDNANLRCHYIDKELYKIGITETVSPQGATVKLYDKERCICDLIRNKNKVDIQIYVQAIRDYFNTKADKRKLLKYSKVFGVEDKVRTYIEIL